MGSRMESFYFNVKVFKNIVLYYFQMNVLEFRTVQSNAIRILIEALKNILSDVNIQVSTDGLKIIALDGSKAAIVHLKLEASQFEYFSCLQVI